MGEDYDGRALAELGVARSADLTHSSLSNQLPNFVMGEKASGFELQRFEPSWVPSSRFPVTSEQNRFPVVLRKLRRRQDMARLVDSLRTENFSII